MYIYKTTNLINKKIYIGQCSRHVNESSGHIGSSNAMHRWHFKNCKQCV